MARECRALTAVLEAKVKSCREFRDPQHLQDWEPLQLWASEHSDVQKSSAMPETQDFPSAELQTNQGRQKTALSFKWSLKDFKKISPAFKFCASTVE